MRGYIDQVSADRTRVAGWVAAADPIDPPRVLALLRGTPVGTVAFGPERVDVRTATGLGNVRFVVSLDEPLDPLALLSGRFRVVSAGADQVELGLSAGGRADERALLLDEVRAVGVTVPCPPDAPLPDEPTSLPQLDPPATPDELSFLPFAAGMTSPDGSAVLGHDGHLFLVGGSNALAAQYAEPASDAARESTARAVAGWNDLVRARERRARSAGCRFAQVVVPEKATVLRSLLDREEAAPTRLLRHLEAALGGVESFMSARTVFDGWAGPEAPYSRLDSHCSPSGSLALVRAMLDRLGLEDAVGDVPMSRRSLYVGDLSERFFGRGLSDVRLEPSSAVLARAEAELVLVETVNPGPGRHIGTKHVWRNPSSLYGERVVVFGNSFFGAGRTTPAKLSWWFARLFREFHFIWSPEMDDDYMASVSPDVVIAQTVERFLPTVPAR